MDESTARASLAVLGLGLAAAVMGSGLRVSPAAARPPLEEPEIRHVGRWIGESGPWNVLQIMEERALADALSLLDMPWPMGGDGDVVFLAACPWTDEVILFILQDGRDPRIVAAFGPRGTMPSADASRLMQAFLAAVRAATGSTHR